MENEETGVASINARICALSQCDSDFLPKVSYKPHIASMLATEGILRLTDALSANRSFEAASSEDCRYD